jgi:hypothetical protein
MFSKAYYEKQAALCAIAADEAKTSTMRRRYLEAEAAWRKLAAGMPTLNATLVDGAEGGPVETTDFRPNRILSR